MYSKYREWESATIEMLTTQTGSKETEAPQPSGERLRQRDTHKQIFRSTKDFVFQMYLLYIKIPELSMIKREITSFPDFLERDFTGDVS